MSENNTNEAVAQNEESVAHDESQSKNTQENPREKILPDEFLKNFDWHKHEQGIENVDENQLKEFDKSLNDVLGFINELEVIQGMVVKITDLDAIIDIG